MKVIKSISVLSVLILLKFALFDNDASSIIGYLFERSTLLFIMVLVIYSFDRKKSLLMGINYSLKKWDISKLIVGAIFLISSFFIGLKMNLFFPSSYEIFFHTLSSLIKANIFNFTVIFLIEVIALSIINEIYFRYLVFNEMLESKSFEFSAFIVIIFNLIFNIEYIIYIDLIAYNLISCYLFYKTRSILNSIIISFIFFSLQFFRILFYF